ncbi:MAG TPA: hypothetical protein VIT93_05850, partial [Dehalococcoidia bacterium]
MTAQAKGHRFPILITEFSQLFMIPFGVTRRRAFAQVQDGELRIRFGPMFDERIPLSNIKAAEVSRWPRWAGVGPRTNFRGVVGLVGSYSNVVRLTLKKPVDVHLYFLPTSCRRLYLTLDHAERFLEAIGKAPKEHVAAK